MLGILGGATPSTPAQRVGPHLEIVDRLGDEGGAGQLIVVEAASATDTWAQLQAFDRVGDRWVPTFDPIDARIGAVASRPTGRRVTARPPPAPSR